VGNSLDTRSYFGKQVKEERKRRGWSQSHMAQLLKDKGFRTYTTTIHKIEAGDRPVPLDEASAIADLFGVSVDRLLGRNLGPEQGLIYTLRALTDTARQSAGQISAMAGALQSRFAELAAFEFEGRETLESEGRRAGDALTEANTALWNLSTFEPPRGAVAKPADEIVERAALAKLLKMMEESSDETKS
jgi:transcriptional regulator with XRE-family HTH domain